MNRCSFYVTILMTMVTSCLRSQINAGLRDHCRRHNVVPTAELAGLPPKPAVMAHQPTPQERQQTRQVIADIINSRSEIRRHFKG
jgi:hypothetical protein